MCNEQLLAQLWEKAGMVIDEQRLRIFRLMTASQQREILDEQIEREQRTKPTKTKGF